MLKEYIVSADRPDDIWENLFRGAYASRKEAERQFHVLARCYLSDPEVYISLGLLVERTATYEHCTVLASKSRHQTHVELSQAYYATLDRRTH